MELRIRNIGKIRDANILIDGITVLAGENDTGKSTVGKVLYCLFNSGYELEKKIDQGREASLERIINFTVREFYDGYKVNDISNFIKILSSLNTDNITEDDVTALSGLLSEFDLPYAFNKKNKIFNGFSVSEVVELRRAYDRIMEIPVDGLVNAMVQSNLNKEFHDAINNIHYDELGSVSLISKSFDIDVEIENNKVTKCEMTSLVSAPIYIDDPFALDSINIINAIYTYNEVMPSMGHQKDLRYKLAMINKEPDIETIMLEIVNNKILEKVWAQFESIKIGSIKINSDNKQSQYIMRDEDVKFNLDSVSTGVKSFAILKQLLVSGLLNKKGVLILDEPEVHLHPKWQMLYAEIIVLLQKYYKLNILINTHSPYFLRAIEVYSNKYDVDDECKYYLTSAADNGFDAVISDVTHNINLIYEVLARPFELLQQEAFADD